MSKLISKTTEHHENHLSEDIPKWFAVYTHYKREKAAAKQLSNSGVEAYLPLQKATRHYTRKTVHLNLPLINHYIFVKITKNEYIKVLQCPYIVQFVKFSKNLVSIPEAEINLIKRVLGELDKVEIDNNLFEKGDYVEVIGGNLTGLKGQLINKENDQYLSIKLINIGVALKVSIAVHLLRKINPSLVKQA